MASGGIVERLIFKTTASEKEQREESRGLRTRPVLYFQFSSSVSMHTVSKPKSNLLSGVPMALRSLELRAQVTSLPDAPAVAGAGNT